MKPHTDKQALLQALWQQINEKGDLPSLSQSVRTIVSAMESEEESNEKLVTAVLADFSLTQKVIRLANSAMYRAFGGDIATVSHAVMILGGSTVGHLALGVKLLDSLEAVSRQEEGAREELAKAALAGSIARHLTDEKHIPGGEEAVVAALLQNVGRLLTAFCFPVQWDDIRKQAGDSRETQDQAAEAVLGVSLTELGQEAARQWGLPQRLSAAMRPLSPEEVHCPLDHGGWLRAVASFCGEMSTALADSNGPSDSLHELASRYSEALALEPDDIHAIAAELMQDQRNTAVFEVISKSKAAQDPSGKPADAEHRLKLGLEEMRRTAANADTRGLITMALETMFQSMGFSRTLAFLRIGKEEFMRVRLGFGQDADTLVNHLEFEEAFAPDVFHLALSSNKAIFIENSRDANIVRRLPTWFDKALPDVHSFALIPIVRDSRPIALLYGDWGKNLAKHQLSQDELSVLWKMVGVLVEASPARAVSL